MMVSQMAYWHSDTEVIDAIEITMTLDREWEVSWDFAQVACLSRSW